MYSIKNNVENTTIIKNSKFITKLYKISNTDEINIILNELKSEYKDSTHICFAYITENNEKCFDDGEPSGTAGIPILNVLKQKKILNILAVVIRYFGGIKLGAGGLIRAYKNSIISALENTDAIELVNGYIINIEFKYDNLKAIDYILNNKIIINKNFNNNIEYEFYLKESEFDLINEIKKLVLNISISKKVLIENY